MMLWGDEWLTVDEAADRVEQILRAQAEQGQPPTAAEDLFLAEALPYLRIRRDEQ